LKRSIFVIIFSANFDIIKAELVGVLRGGNDTHPALEGVLLQKLFGEVLEVALGQGDAGCDGDFNVAIAYDLDVVSELAGFTLDLDAIVQEFFKVCTVKDLFFGGQGVVDNKLVL